MGFRYCRYCEKIEGNLSLMYEYVNSKGKKIIDDVHIACKAKDDFRKNQENYLNKVKIKKCYFCGIPEPDKTKVNKQGNHLLCSENSKKEKDKIYQNKQKDKRREKREFKKKNIVDRINETPERKTCTKCDENKHISEFYQNRNMTYYYHCKVCHSRINKESRNKNKYKVNNYQKVYQKAYYHENKEKISSRQKGYYIKRKEKLKNNNQPEN